MAGIDSQRRQNREDLRLEKFVNVCHSAALSSSMLTRLILCLASAGSSVS
jgi:hypothetical protein